MSRESFWNKDHTNIYTSNVVEVFKVFKGNAGVTEVQIITMGGAVGKISESVSEALELSIGDMGIFLCKVYQLNLPGGDLLKLRPYGRIQGFIKYDITENKAMDGLQMYESIQDLYSEIMRVTGEEYHQVKEFDFQTFQRRITRTTKSVPQIDSFSPKSIPAGTGQRLTIRGSGFGNNQGSGKV